MRPILILATLALLGLPAAAAEPAPALDPERGIVFAGAMARDLVRQCSRPSPGPVSGTWTPGARIIEALEAKLAPILDGKLQAQGSRARARDYYRQYGGLIIGGTRIVYVNGFHKQIVDNAIEAVRHGGHADPQAWRRKPTRICDGGSITFGVEYDPRTGAFARFRFNGALPRPRR